MHSHAHRNSLVIVYATLPQYRDGSKTRPELNRLLGALPTSTGFGEDRLTDSLTLMGIQSPVVRTTHRAQKELEPVMTELDQEAAREAAELFLEWVLTGCDCDLSDPVAVRRAGMVRDGQSEGSYSSRSRNAAAKPCILPCRLIVFGTTVGTAEVALVPSPLLARRVRGMHSYVRRTGTAVPRCRTIRGPATN